MQARDESFDPDAPGPSRRRATSDDEDDSFGTNRRVTLTKDFPNVQLIFDAVIHRRDREAAYSMAVLYKKWRNATKQRIKRKSGGKKSGNDTSMSSCPSAPVRLPPKPTKEVKKARKAASKRAALAAAAADVAAKRARRDALAMAQLEGGNDGSDEYEDDDDFDDDDDDDLMAASRSSASSMNF